MKIFLSRDTTGSLGKLQLSHPISGDSITQQHRSFREFLTNHYEGIHE